MRIKEPRVPRRRVFFCAVDAAAEFREEALAGVPVIDMMAAAQDVHIAGIAKMRVNACVARRWNEDKSCTWRMRRT